MARHAKLRVAGWPLGGVRAHHANHPAARRGDDAGVGRLRRRPAVPVQVEQAATATVKEHVDPAVGSLVDRAGAQPAQDAERILGEFLLGTDDVRPVPCRHVRIGGVVWQRGVERLFELEGDPVLAGVGVVGRVVIAEEQVPVGVEKRVAGAGARFREAKLLRIEAAVAVGVGPGEGVGLWGSEVELVEGRRLHNRLRNGVFRPAVEGLEARQRYRNEFTGLRVGPQDEAAVGDEIDLALPHHRPVVRKRVGNRKEAVAPALLRHREDVRKPVLPGCGIEVVAADRGGTGTIKNFAWIARHRRGAREEFRAAKPLVENCAVRRHVGDPPQPAAGLAPFDDVEPALFRGDAIGRQVGDFGEAVGEVRPGLAAPLDAVALL